jgi:hypothetical protein
MEWRMRINLEAREGRLDGKRHVLSDVECIEASMSPQLDA